MTDGTYSDVPFEVIIKNDVNGVWREVGKTLATYLKDEAGNYVINPATEEPYKVPLGYNPNTTIQSFANGNIFDLLLSFYPGGINDLQRGLGGQQFGGFVDEFRAIASFNFGLACAAVNISLDFCKVGGGTANLGSYVGKWGQSRFFS